MKKQIHNMENNQNRYRYLVPENTQDRDGYGGMNYSLDVNSVEGKQKIKNKVVLSKVIPGSENKAREYFEVFTPTDAIKRLLMLRDDGTELNLDEVITGSRKEKMRFDFDFKCWNVKPEIAEKNYGIGEDDMDDMDLWIKAFERDGGILDRLCQNIHAYFVQFHPMPIFDVYTSHGDTGDIGKSECKLSAHIVIRNILCNGSKASKKIFSGFVAEANTNNILHKEEINQIDIQIYKKNGGLRALFATKNGRQKVYYGSFIYTRNSTGGYIRINNGIVPKWEPIMSLISYTKKDSNNYTIKSAKDEKIEINLTKPTDLPNSLEMEIAVKWCSENGYSLGNRISSGYRVEKDINRGCVLCGHEHKNQLGYIKFKDGRIWFNCWSAIADHNRGKPVKYGIWINKPEMAPKISDIVMWTHPANSVHEFNDFTSISDITELATWAVRNVAFISEGGKSYYVTRNIKEGEIKYQHIQQSDINRIPHRWYTEKLVKNKKGESTTSKEAITMLDILGRDDVLKHITYKSADFMPPSIGPVGGVFNTFIGFKHEALTSYDESKFELITNHLREVWCDNNIECYEFLLNLWAHIVQKPNVRAETALIIMSERQGTGKGIIVDFLGKKVIGNRYYHYTENLDRLFDKFNSEQSDKLLTLVDEASTNERSISSISEQLKAFITRTKFCIERKGMDKVEVNDYNNLIFATNKATPFNIDRSDRRFMVLEVNDKYAGKHDYFRALADSMTDEAGQHFFTMLKLRDISKFNPHEKPMTDIKRQMIFERLPDYILFLIDIARSGKPEVSESCADFYEKYADYCKINGRNKMTVAAFGRQVSKLIPAKCKKISGKVVKWRQISMTELQVELNKNCNMDIDYTCENGQEDVAESDNIM